MGGESHSQEQDCKPLCDSVVLVGEGEKVYLSAPFPSLSKVRRDKLKEAWVDSPDRYLLELGGVQTDRPKDQLD